MDKKVVFHAKKTIGKLKDAGKVTLELTIYEENREQMTIDHNTVNSYKTLSICGEIRSEDGRHWYSCGQIIDHLTPDNFSQLDIFVPELMEIVSIWKHYHLNDLNAGCVHQDAVPSNETYNDWKVLQAIETQKCPHRYEYGSSWLLKELPEEIVQRAITLFS